jgi:hypothetical protein
MEAKNNKLKYKQVPKYEKNISLTLSFQRTKHLKKTNTSKTKVGNN